MVYHIIMLVLVFIAVIIMTGGNYGVGSYRNVDWNWNAHYKTMVQAARAYNVSVQHTLHTSLSKSKCFDGIVPSIFDYMNR